MANFMLCKVCGKQISDTAYCCPGCGVKYNRGAIYKKWWFWLIAIAIVWGLYGNTLKEMFRDAIWFVSDSIKKELAELESANGLDDLVSESNSNNIVPKGVQFFHKDVGVTVLGYREVDPGAYRKLDEGQRLFAINIEIDNTANLKSVFSSTMLTYSLLDSNGYKCEVDLVGSGTGSIDGNVPAGAKAKGEVLFKVNDNAYPQTLLVNFNLLGSPTRFDVR